MKCLSPKHKTFIPTPKPAATIGRAGTGVSCALHCLGVLNCARQHLRAAPFTRTFSWRAGIRTRSICIRWVLSPPSRIVGGQSNLFIVHLEALIGMARDPSALFQVSPAYGGDLFREGEV